MKTENKDVLAEKTSILASKLFEKASAEFINNSVNLLINNKVLFLFGTAGNSEWSEYSKDKIYIYNLINHLKNQLDLKNPIQLHFLLFNDSLDRMISNIPDIANIRNKATDVDSIHFLVFKKSQAYFESISTAAIENELSYIKDLKNSRFYSIFYLESVRLSHAFAHMAVLLNQVSQFIPEVTSEGIEVFIEEVCADVNLKLSPSCRELMLNEIVNHQIPLSIVVLCIQQIQKLLKEKKEHENIISIASFNEIGGFQHLIQKQYDVFLNKNFGAKGNSGDISFSASSKTLKYFFRSFLEKDSNDHFFLRSLTVEQIKNISNLSIFQVENIIRALETYSFPFIKKENDHYTLFSTDFLTHWPEMALWKKEELAHIHLYLSLHAKAVSYQNGIGELLSGSGLEEAFIWLNESNHNVHWACYYATAYELTIQFIEYAVSEKKKALEANQRRSKRLLKISRGIAFVIGFAFILSSLAAILAGIERNNALLSKKNAEVERKIAIRAKEQAVAAKEFAEMERKKALMASKAERIAKRLAENERLQAIVARDMANQEKINALISRNAEITAKEQAELDRSLAILARDVAENERKNAIEARLATDKALIQASTNFNRAEKLRKQQEARADALNAFRYYLNHQFMEGLTLSISAYAINNQNDGNRYEPEIFKSMVHGLTAVKPNTFSLKLKQPLKKITISPDGKLIAAYSIGGILTIFQPDFNIKKEINIPFQSFQSFCFTRDNHLLVGSSDGFISLYDIGSGNIKWSRFIAKAPIVSILHLREDKYIFGSGDNIFLLNGLLPISSLQKNTLPMEKTLGKITKGIDSDNIYVTVGNSVYAIKIKNDTFQITWKKIMEIPHIIQQIAFKEYQNQSYLILGDQKGNIYLVHATTGQLIFQKKAHQSSSTYCKLDLLNDDLLLISSGLDHKVMIDYLTKNEKDSFLLKSSVDFNLHSAWVTDMTYDTNTGNYFSCSDDMNVRKWNFNPVDIYNMAKAFLKDNNEYQAK